MPLLSLYARVCGACVLVHTDRMLEPLLPPFNVHNMNTCLDLFVQICTDHVDRAYFNYKWIPKLLASLLLCSSDSAYRRCDRDFLFYCIRP